MFGLTSAKRIKVLEDLILQLSGDTDLLCERILDSSAEAIRVSKECLEQLKKYEELSNNYQKLLAMYEELEVLHHAAKANG